VTRGCPNCGKLTNRTMCGSCGVQTMTARELADAATRAAQRRLYTTSERYEAIGRKVARANREAV